MITNYPTSPQTPLYTTLSTNVSKLTNVTYTLVLSLLNPTPRTCFRSKVIVQISSI